VSHEEQRAFFLSILQRLSAAQIARDTGYSDSTVSQVKNNKYPGDEAAFLDKVLLIYGSWNCAALGQEIDYKTCSSEQARPYSAARVRQWATCQQCGRRKE